MRPRREEHALLRGNERTPSEPARGCVPIHRRSAEALVAQQRIEIGGDARKPLPHPRKQLRIVGLGRHVHCEIRARAPRTSFAANRRVPPNEGAAPDDRFDETALSGLDISSGDRGEVERKAAGEVSLRRQAIPGS